MSHAYFHHRTGTTKQPSIDLGRFREFVGALIDVLEGGGYLQQAFGYDCVDAGQVGGDEGRSLGQYLLVEALLTVPDPVPKNLVRLSEPELLGLHEVLWRVISKPTAGRYHDYGNCGYHYSAFDRPEGQKFFADRANRYLRFVHPGYRLTEEGTIELLLDDPAAGILESPLPGSAPEPVRIRVDKAVKRFRAGLANWDERESAVRELGDVLEFLRPEAKEHLFRKDEAEIFRLLNEFGVRHLNAQQRLDYDRPIFLTWLFYHMLAAIHACVRLTERKA